MADLMVLQRCERGKNITGSLRQALGESQVNYWHFGERPCHQELKGIHHLKSSS